MLLSMLMAAALAVPATRRVSGDCTDAERYRVFLSYEVQAQTQSGEPSIKTVRWHEELLCGRAEAEAFYARTQRFGLRFGPYGNMDSTVHVPPSAIGAPVTIRRLLP